MARKKQPTKKTADPNVIGLRAETLEQPITETLEANFMPYAMSAIVSRAIPEIDGFKPAHRKLLYTMYKMGLLGGARTKSSNIVGQTMRLNPHGEGAIYETLVRLSAGYEALLTPFVDSKGNFGKVYSSDMKYASARYTEARLSPICNEIFRDIDRDTVDFTDNYDSTTTEPTLLPTSFPNVLVSANMGIAVGMASRICGFNLTEVCKTTVAYLRDEKCDLTLTMPAPDFPTGGELLYDAKEIATVYETGRGSFRVRSKWRYVKEENIVEITEIPYSTTAEAIIKKTAELVTSGKLKEISDMRDETGLEGLKIAIDLKRGVDPDKLMAKLMKLTPLCDSFSCDFNILIAGVPRVMGVREILCEWTAWRRECVRRRVFSEAEKKREKLHVLYGLAKVLLDIDRAIKIIRETEEEREVIPNLMIGFGIDEPQAEYIAEIRLRNINREYLLRRTEETKTLEDEIADLEDILKKPNRIRDIIIKELEAIIKKYGIPRKTGIVYEHEIDVPDEDDGADDYPVTVFVSREGYIKKITAASLRMNSEQKFKEGDSLSVTFPSTNRCDLLVFTDKQQVYKTRLCDIDDTKASSLGTFLPSFLSFDDGEAVLQVVSPGDYSADILFVYQNGKAARVPLASYATKTNRKKLTGAYSDKAPVTGVFNLSVESEIALFSSDGRALIFSSGQLKPIATRSTQGVQVFTLRRKAELERAAVSSETNIVNASRYRARSIPATGAKLTDEDNGIKQLSIENPE